MNRLVTTCAVMAVLCDSAGAEFKLACVKAEDERVIEVVTPGKVGASCDVRYTRTSTGETSAPYHADNTSDYCTQKAQDLADVLRRAGYSCGAPGAVAVAKAISVDEAQIESAQMAIVDGDDARALENDMNRILVREPAAQADPAEPGQPSAKLEQPKMQTLAAKAPAPVNAAQPSASTPLTQAAFDAPAAKKAASSPQSASKPTVPAASEIKPSSRAPEEVVIATMNAQVAAWNEGDLDAFMNGYWNDDNLKFVAGQKVTKGWSSTKKRYRDNYAGENGLGFLSLDKVDVQMVGEDVAIATGRFKLVNEAQNSGGFFTLVLRRLNGVWRIVHDHTVADAPAPIADEVQQ